MEEGHKSGVIDYRIYSLCTVTDETSSGPYTVLY